MINTLDSAFRVSIRHSKQLSFIIRIKMRFKIGQELLSSKQVISILMIDTQKEGDLDKASLRAFINAKIEKHRKSLL